MNGRILFALILMGFTALVAQTLAIREFLVSFYGNELTIGMILANWILLGAIGSALASRIARGNKVVAAYTLIQAGLTIYLPVAVWLMRDAKNIMGYSAGEGIGPLPILMISFLILAPLGILIGSQFPLGAAVLSRATGKTLEPAGMVYILEGIGFMIAGPVFTYILIVTFNSFNITFLMGAVNLVSAIFLLKEEFKKAYAKIILIFIAVLLAAVLISLFFFSGRLNAFSIKNQWRGAQIIRYTNSIYGNLTVSRSGSQYTFYSNGIPVIASPVPDIVSVEERAHFTMLAAKDPKRVLLIGGGAGGVIREVLKYPVEYISYVELDPALIRLVKEFPTTLTKDELEDKRVRIYYLDGRRFLRETGEKYDVVMVGLPMPSTIQLNRFYTAEFFVNVRRVLTDNGVFSFYLPGSLSYISAEQARLNASVLATLKSALRADVIPGDSNLYLASKAPVNVDSRSYLKRLEAYGIKTALMNEQYFNHRLDPAVKKWFYRETDRFSGVRKNTDLLPSGTFYGIWYWSSLFSKRFAGGFGWLNKLDVLSAFTGLGLIGVILMVLNLAVSRTEKLCSSFVLGSTGFTGMTLSLLIMYAYQSFYGFIFQQVAMLVTFFMAGLALGSFMMNRRLASLEDKCTSFFLIELGCFVFSLSMVPALSFFDIDPRPGLAWAFFLMSAISGLFIGLEFPLANKIYASGEDAVSSSGILYAVDLIGSWAAALIASVALVPVIGMIWTALLLAGLKGLSLFLILTSSRG